MFYWFFDGGVGVEKSVGGLGCVGIKKLLINI
jgi:hypothetical protein